MSQLNIVIADDNTEHAESLAQVLNLWGHVVNVCHSHEKTIDCCIKHWPDVVLLEVRAPVRTNDLSIASHLREWPRLREATMIAIATCGDNEVPDLTKKAGYDHYMAKPIDMDELKQILAQVVPQKKSLVVVAC